MKTHVFFIMKLPSFFGLVGLLAVIPAAVADDLSVGNIADLSADKDKVRISHEFSADYGYVGGARTYSGNLRFGDVEEQSNHLNYVLAPQIEKRVILRFGVDWQRFSFSLPNNTPLPNRLQSTALVVGGDFMLSDQWLLRVETQPGVYSDFQDISSRDFNSPVVFGGAYLVDEHLQWFFGLSVDTFRHFPVIPVVGARWKFADEWTLMFILPKPRLEYELDKNIILYAGGELKGGTYRVGENFGDPFFRSELNNAMVDYTEGRIGVGSGWKLTPSLTLDVEGGYMVYREFDFHRSATRIKSDPAPYGQAAVSMKF